MRRSLTSIASLGILSAIFLAVMSMVYLSRMPTKADFRALEDDLRRQHGLYLSVSSPLTVAYIAPEGDAEVAGLRVSCAIRPDLAKDDRIVDLHLARIAQSVLEHPDWRFHVQYVTVAQEWPKPRTVTHTRPAPKGS